ncbi:FkbO/Hyg5 family chorismatase [Actinoplanes bogorensis]|uniref:FkbO/Hyg5 family chorismatase n=1 Tax=Paractinoplanes bogorensis TaxID=1610840 RepID=A0ABS5YK40_9ACTN|nr:FkbO/Hyg5 family chorismatase [Actinoplanes bogorensis]MBU2663849.1 FkbO/Hyg5 family chorismatase [Actinoplanes bogorensis]
MTQTPLSENGIDQGYALSTTLVDPDVADMIAARENVLGRVDYTTAAADPILSARSPRLALHMAHGKADSFSELWTTPHDVTAGMHDGVAYAHDGEFLFVAGRIAESGHYATATEKAYLTALGLIRDLGYPNCYRMWNVVGAINEDNAEGLENYRDFCLGRADAFATMRFNETEIPAATGIGALGGGIGFYFLTSRSGSPIAIENPQQVSAYHYPQRYGPKAPKFARATRMGGRVYVSGTASITGHESRHEGDLVRQTHLSLENIARVIGASNLWEHGIGDGYFLANLDHIKVYVRHAEDIPVVRGICERAFSPAAEVRYLNVDVCRSDLLVEIEGIAY